MLKFQMQYFVQLVPVTSRSIADLVCDAYPSPHNMEQVSSDPRVSPHDFAPQSGLTVVLLTTKAYNIGLEDNYYRSTPGISTPC